MPLILYCSEDFNFHHLFKTNYMIKDSFAVCLPLLHLDKATTRIIFRQAEIPDFVFLYFQRTHYSEVYIIVPKLITYFCCYDFHFAVYKGVEPLSQDRQSSIMTVIRIDHYLLFVFCGSTRNRTETSPECKSGVLAV